jgi:hypothetical protein
MDIITFVIVLSVKIWIFQCYTLKVSDGTQTAKKRAITCHRLNHLPPLCYTKMSLYPPRDIIQHLAMLRFIE